MKIVDIIYNSLHEDQDQIKSAIIDILTVMTGEGVDSMSLDVIQRSLGSQGIDVDEHALFDICSNLAIVRNIKDGIVYFNSDSDQSQYQDTPADPQKQDKKIDTLARKQVKKELDK
jgi:hypothetical protein